MKNVEIGRLGEKLAAKHLRKNGYKVLGRNLHFSHNELDIIAKNKKFIVFVEVKTRSVDETFNTKYGSPASAVDKAKQQRTISAARTYLHSSNNASLQPRFDVIEIYLKKDTLELLLINHITNAFGA